MNKKIKTKVFWHWKVLGNEDLDSCLTDGRNIQQNFVNLERFSSVHDDFSKFIILLMRTIEHAKLAYLTMCNKHTTPLLHEIFLETVNGAEYWGHINNTVGTWKSFYTETRDFFETWKWKVWKNKPISIYWSFRFSGWFCSFG